MQTIEQFVEACKSLNSQQVYELFEFEISEELRDKIYAIADDKDAFEPVRLAMYKLGKQYNVRSLLDY